MTGLIMRLCFSFTCCHGESWYLSILTPSFILHAECSSEPLYSDLIEQTLENGLRFRIIWRSVNVMHNSLCLLTVVTEQVVFESICL